MTGNPVIEEVRKGEAEGFAGYVVACFDDTGVDAARLTFLLQSLDTRQTVDLEAQTVTTSDGQVFAFEVDSHRKHCLLNGLDDIGLTLEKAAAIDSFEAQTKALRPWA